MLKPIKLLIVFITLVTAWTGWMAVACANEKTDSYAFIIIVEGLTAEDLKEGQLPNIKKIVNHGMRYLNVSKPEEAENTLYGILGRQKGKLLLPSLLEQAEIKSLLLDGSGGIKDPIFKESGMEVISEANDSELMNQYLNDFPEEYRLVVITLDDTINSNKSDRYFWSNIDNQIGRLLNHLANTDTLNQSSILLAGDSNTPALVLFNTQQNYAPVYNYCNLKDIAPTACRILGFEPAVQLPGNILYEFFFKPGNSQTQQRIKDLQHTNKLANDKIKSLEKQNILIQNDMQKINTEKQHFDSIISEKDQEIGLLILKLKIYKFLGGLGIIFVLAILIIEYKVLRKKFLLFP